MLNINLPLNPRSIKAYLVRRPKLSGAVANTSWLLGEKVIRQIVNLTVGVWVARYLGPADFGSLNYALSLVLLFSALATLGLERIVVRELVNASENSSRILGTAFLLRLASGLLTVFFPLLIVHFLRPADSLTLFMVGIIAFGNIFQASDVLDYWFQSRTLSKYSIFAKGSAFLLASAGKVLLISMNASLIAFAWVALFEIVAASFGLIIVFSAKWHSMFSFSFSKEKAKELLSESWPLIISGIAITAYMRIDQTMLGEIVGAKEVGIYSAAVRLSEVWSFIPVAITTSFFPILVESKNKDSQLYMRRLQHLFFLMAGIAYAIALPMTFISNRLIILLFGVSYASAGPVLSLHIWSAPFLFLGVARGIWAINEGLTKFIFATTFLGTIVNISLNLYLIPMKGAIGAAIALLCSQIVASYVSNLFYKDTRHIFFMQSKALVPLFIFSKLRRRLGYRCFLL